MMHDEFKVGEKHGARRILVTGASGFVGTRLCRELVGLGHAVRCVQRREGLLVAGCEHVLVGDIGESVDWEVALAGIDVVIHLAARVHVMRYGDADPLAAFRRVNVEGTERLAAAAARAGAGHFIFVSSVKVNGESTCARPFMESDVPCPEDPYGVSKLEAEQVLREVGSATGMSVTILRPVLIYGPGVKANFLKLVELAIKGLPLPFGSIRNKRSLLGLGNFTDLIGHCVTCSAARDETFLVSDGPALSTPDLIRAIARVSGRRARLIPVSPLILKFLGHLVGKQDMIGRLIGSLEVDSSKTRSVLGWTPPYTVEQELEKTIAWYTRAVESIEIPP